MYPVAAAKAVSAASLAEPGSDSTACTRAARRRGCAAQRGARATRRGGAASCAPDGAQRSRGSACIARTASYRAHKTPPSVVTQGGEGTSLDDAPSARANDRRGSQYALERAARDRRKLRRSRAVAAMAWRAAPQAQARLHVSESRHARLRRTAAARRAGECRHAASVARARRAAVCIARAGAAVRGCSASSAAAGDALARWLSQWRRFDDCGVRVSFVNERDRCVRH